MSGDRFDLVIAGGGPAGLALAATLARRFGRGFRVLLAEPAAAAAPVEDGRAYAIGAFGCRLLDTLGVWRQLQPAAQPITAMRISDSALEDIYRPVLLSFAGESAPGEAFAHMVPHAPLMAALAAAANRAGVTVAATRAMSATASKGGLTATLADGSAVSAPLIVAADGKRSRLREAAGIASHGWAYGQDAIVATIAHERAHDGVAVQHFLPAGPFALLPLKAPDGSGTWTSIVWSEHAATARDLVAGDPDRFQDALERRFGAERGAIRLVGRPQLFPLEMRLARRLNAGRLALMGDAARTVHPLAGQGLNLALKDVAALAECIAGAARLGLDIGGAPVLEDYQRRRRLDGALMAAMTDGLNRLFSARSPALRAARDVGLGLVDRLPPLKRALISEAAGVAPAAQEVSSSRRASSGSMIGMPSRIG